MPNSPFESIKHIVDEMEVWYARELYPLLGYTNWNKFQDVIEKAKQAIVTSGS
jgi:DNA-damage-inducible protein D